MSLLDLLATLCGVLLFWPGSRTEVVNIVPTDDDLCTLPCFTLSDFAANLSIYNISSNITLILSPGRHVLHLNMSISNLDAFVMFSSSLPAQIVCEQNSSFSFDNCYSVYITSINFIGCRENAINQVNNFELQNSVFEGQGGSGSTIGLFYSTAQIYGSKFIVSNVSGNNRTYPENQQICVLGGAILAQFSNVTIAHGLFEKHWGGIGGALFLSGSNVRIESSVFTGNEAVDSETGLCDIFPYTMAGAVFQLESNVVISNSHFSRNSAEVGGGITIYSGTLSINASTFHDNEAERIGGAIFSLRCTVTMNRVQLARNAAIHATGGGGALIGSESNVTILESQFDRNLASFGGAMFFQNSFINLGGNILLVNNSGIYGVLYAFNTSLTMHDFLNVSNNSASAAKSGPLTLFQSNVVSFGHVTFKGNEAETGGAIYSSETKIDVIGDMKILDNVARSTGGGVYLYQSELNCQGSSTFILRDNGATFTGGSIHAIGSTIKVIAITNRTILAIKNNLAQTGGGICLESNAKLYTIKPYKSYSNLIQFIENAADYGGAVYVDDDTYTATCTRQDTACFIQEFTLYEANEEGISIKFKDNQARIRGSNLFGGLLHRCSIVQPIVQAAFFSANSKTVKGVSHFRTATNTSSVNQISSRPVQICLCVNGHLNCTIQQRPTYEVKKGEKFSVSLVAVDQLGHPVSAKIQSLLRSNMSGLLEGQLTRTIAGECIDLNFNVISPGNSEQLSLYASDGPCRNAESATIRVDVHFLPCTCPIGFQPSYISDVNCTCECHGDLVQYVSMCDTQSQTLTKRPQTKAWITSISFDNTTSYIIYPNCPYDYCKYGQSQPIDLNQLNGADIQCAFGRSALLCGSCQSGLSLSIGSSRCIQCPTHWPVLFVVINVAAVLAGVVLVAMLMLLNMTVSVGTLNGLIFYANIISPYKSILLPVQESNRLVFANVVVSWLNLDIGIDSCYFKGMNAYAKTWLQLAFPAYVFILVATVIVCSSRFSKFSNLIGKRNPVATLATLILLSYTKMLEIVFRAFSSGTINSPDGSIAQVWLPDATVNYFSLKHSLLFIVSIIILLIGLIYTILLFLWQWLLCLPTWRVFKWISNQKLHGFMETYNIPYKPQHRYWTGMLLFARIILHLIAAVNVSNDAQLALASITFVVGTIFLLRALIRGALYRNKLVDIVETAFYFNILAFATLTWYAINKQVVSYNSVIVHTSIIVTVLLLLLIILYHLYTYTPALSRIVNKTAFGKKLNTVLLSMQEPVGFQQNIRHPTDTFNDDFLDTIENATADHKLGSTHREAEPTHTDVVIHTPLMPRAQRKDEDTIIN